MFPSKNRNMLRLLALQTALVIFRGEYNSRQMLKVQPPAEEFKQSFSKHEGLLFLRNRLTLCRKLCCNTCVNI